MTVNANRKGNHPKILIFLPNIVSFAGNILGMLNKVRRVEITSARTAKRACINAIPVCPIWGNNSAQNDAIAGACSTYGKLGIVYEYGSTLGMLPFSIIWPVRKRYPKSGSRESAPFAKKSATKTSKQIER